MIPRYQKILFAVLLVASLVDGRRAVAFARTRPPAPAGRRGFGADQAPEVAPHGAGHAAGGERCRRLAAGAGAFPAAAWRPRRARPRVLGKLLDLYAAPGAAHPVPAASIAQVFLVSAQVFS